MEANVEEQVVSAVFRAWKVGWYGHKPDTVHRTGTMCGASSDCLLCPDGVCVCVDRSNRRVVRRRRGHADGLPVVDAATLEHFDDCQRCRD